MRFDEQIFWSDGLFIQPHHFQQLQKYGADALHKDREIFHAFPYGLLDYELNTDALRGGRIQFLRLSAVMPDGTCVSMPGNSVLQPLDVSKQEIGEGGILIHLAIPRYSEHEGNLGESENDKRAFLVREKLVRDENSGENEISLVRRVPNVRLVVGDAKDMVLLPVLRLVRGAQGASGTALAADPDYLPPFLRLTPDCPLYAQLTDLVWELRQRRDRLVSDLSESGCSPETLSGTNLYNMLQLRCVNMALARFEAALEPCSTDPFGLYRELSVLFGELCALHPERIFEPVPSYRHPDAAPAFQALFHGIRALILAGGGLGFVKIDFADKDGVPVARLDAERLATAGEYYLAVSCSADSRKIVNALEQGDEFKLVNPSALAGRVRGVRLQELHYPPRCLPSLPNTLWFLLKRHESARIWNDIIAENAAAIDYAAESFPQLEASLYITINTKGGANGQPT